MEQCLSTLVCAPLLRGSCDLSKKEGVNVNILGPLQIQNGCHVFRRHQSRELVVYLALHKHGASAGQIALSLWPEGVVSAPTRHAVLCDARRVVGEDRLKKSNDLYVLDASSDWEKFVALAASEERAALRSAMALIRGQPFEGFRQCEWLETEGIMTRVEERISEVARRLHHHAQKAGDLDEAQWALNQAIVACPFDERLYRALMSTADEAGHPAGVRAALERLLTVLGLTPSEREGALNLSQIGTLERYVHRLTARDFRHFSQRSAISK
jgi:DNA-binding SARP family transcriptional activator